MAGNWARYWGPSNAPIYPFLKGSGGLFTTPRDYARFLEFWIKRGDTGAGGKPLLSSSAFERALMPASRDTMNTGFPGATSDYGQMWILFRAQPQLEGAGFGFGHGGSDGTLAYAFPERDLVVCYFTQSRGNTTRNTFEAALSHLFLKPDAEAFARLSNPVARGGFDEFLGLYAPGNRANAIGAIIETNGRLAFELPNRQVMVLRATDERDRWVPERALNDSIVFNRENGRVVGLTLTRNGKATDAPRFRPDADLPTVDELMILRARAASPELFAALLPLRFTGTLETQGRQMPVTTILARDMRSFTEISLEDSGRIRSWTDGARVWRQSPGADATVEVTGLERSQEIDASLAVAMGDWRNHYAEVVVLAREIFEGAAVYRVRTVPREGFASTKLVNAETGVVVAEFRIILVAGGGIQPSETRFSDLRVVEGVTLASGQSVRIAGTQLKMTFSEITPRAEFDPAMLQPSVTR
jgi:hypothetical protein